MLENHLASGIGEENTSLGISQNEEGNLSSSFTENLSPIEQLQLNEEARENNSISVFPQSISIAPVTSTNGLSNLSSLTGARENSKTAAVANIDIDTLFPHPEPLEGDADGDCDIDFDDVRAISAARGDTATGEDVRDLDDDGVISVLDARKLVVILRRNTDFDAPIVGLGLANDTGIDSEDRITSDFNLLG